MSGESEGEKDKEAWAHGLQQVRGCFDDAINGEHTWWRKRLRCIPCPRSNEPTVGQYGELHLGERARIPIYNGSAPSTHVQFNTMIIDNRSS
jgi:hypothetical protein